ncbi:phage tail tape measure protein [Streptosporangium sp. NPDC051022]|uniref:phage tail tape measure protein n=1 Tax=Streptosporangium sp. NPDC051022 TaxID=3155752 RepID=UPI00342198E2
MALTIGELVGFIDLEDKGFASGLAGAARDMSRLQSSTTGTMSSVESTVVKSLDEIEKAIADGLDPTEAIRELDKLDAALDASFDEMLAEADAFAAELDAAINEAFDRLDDDARESGRRAGDELTDGLRDGLRDAERIARESGEESGQEFGDGVEQSGGGRMSGVGTSLMDGLKTAGIGLALAAGTAIGAALVDGIQGALEKEEILAELFAKVGASEKEMERFGRVAGQVYADGYGEGLGDVTEAVRSLIQNVDGIRGASEESLGTLSKRALDTAQILDEDVSTVVRAVAKMLATDLVSSADEAFDLLVRGAQLSGNEADDLLDTFSEYSTQFRTLGLSGEQAMGLIVQALRGGARDSDTAADAVKEFAIEAVQGGARVKQGFKDLGLNADDMVARFAKGGPTAAKAFDLVLDKLRGIEDPAKRNAVAVELFGTKAEDLGAALFAMDPSKAVDALGQVDGAAKKAGDTLHDTASNKIEQWKRGLTTGIVDFLGGTVLPGIESFVTQLNENFNFTDALAKVEEWKEKLGEIWDSIVADVQEWVSENQATIDEWTAKLQDGMATVGEVVDDALTIAKELWDEYGDDVITTVTYLVDTFLSIWNGFWKIVSGAIKVVKGVMTGDMTELKDGLRKIWDALWQMVEDTIKRTLAAVGKIAGDTWEQLKSDAASSWKRISTAVSDGIDAVVKFVKGLPAKIQAVFTNAGNWLLQVGRDLIQGMINGVRAKAAELAAAAKATVDNAVQVAKNALGISSPSKVFEQIGKWTVQGLIVGLTAEGGNAVSTVEKMVEQIKAAFKGRPDVVDGLLDFVKGGNDSLAALAKQREELVKKLAEAKEYAKKIAGDAQEWASITGIKLPESGGSASDFTNGLKSRAQSIKDFASDIQTLAKRGLNKTTLRQIIEAGVEQGGSLADMLVGADGSEIKAINRAQKQIDNMSKQLGKNSADALYDVGKKAGEGYLKGLEDSLKKLDKEMEKIAKALIAALKRELKIKSPSQVMAEIGQYTIEGLIQGIQAGENATVNAMTAVIAKAVKASTTAGSIGQAAASTTAKIGIVGAVGSGGNGGQVAGITAGGWGSPAPASTTTSGVTVNIENATVREDADITKLGAQFGFEYSLRGSV